MKISYAITVCTEVFEIQRLLMLLNKHKRPQDEIVVLYDNINGNPLIKENLSKNPEIRFHTGEFKGHFADWKNHLTSLCSGDYIFNIDADEMVSEYLLEILPSVLETNHVDVIKLPRINTVEGLTPEHIAKWGWRVNEKGWVNFPDPQWRIYRNDPSIVWQNKVHEVLVGHKTMSHLPAEEEFCILHPKTIERQEKQNNFYSTL